MKRRVVLWAVVSQGEAKSPFVCFGPGPMLLVFENRQDALSAATSKVTGLHESDLHVIPLTGTLLPEHVGIGVRLNAALSGAAPTEGGTT